MLLLAFLAAAVVGIGDRPAEILAGGDQVQYAAWLSAEAVKSEATYSRSKCPKAVVRSLEGARLGDEFFAREAMPREALKHTPFQERLSVEGCGRTSVQNILIAVTPDGQRRAIVMFPGESNAGLRLQRDTLAAAVQAALLNPPKLPCDGDELKKNWRLVETSITTRPGQDGAWKERWMFRACDVDRPVAVTFTPSAAGGTSYAVSKDW